MRIIPTVFLLASLAAMHLRLGTAAFSIQPSTKYVLEALRPTHRSRLVPLRYRELEEDDDDSTMLQVQTRAPPGFNMTENLANRGPKSAMNLRLILALLINQCLILLAANVILAAIFFGTDGIDGFSHFQEILHWGGEGNIDLTMSPIRVALGFLGALPIIAIGNLVENSDNRAFANVNFSTITMVLTLFGRRKSPPSEFLPERLKGTTMPTTGTMDVLLWSFALASATGICEETVFRMEIPALLSHYFGGYPLLPLIGQALLFGLGHAQPSTGWAENIIVVGLQIVNGFIFGLLYLLSGGDLVPCIVAHAVYDFSVFFKSWIDANSQVEYAETMFLEPLPSTVQKDVDQVLRAFGAKMDPRVFSAVKRLFYIFDFDKNKTLSKAEVRKGFSYLALEKAGNPPPQKEVDTLFDTYTSEKDKNRLSFVDFLRLYTQSGAFKDKGEKLKQ